MTLMVAAAMKTMNSHKIEVVVFLKKNWQSYLELYNLICRWILASLFTGLSWPLAMAFSMLVGFQC
jgi:hypothetical protein